MSTNMTSQKLSSSAQPRMPFSRFSNPSRHDDSSSGAETSSRKLQKTASNNSSVESSVGSMPIRSATEQRATLTTRRRPSIREQQLNPSGRPAGNTRRMHSGDSSADSSDQSSRALPMGNTRSRFSFGIPTTVGESARIENHTPPDGTEFLKPISFDDFHNSIMSKDPTLSHFPLPAGYDTKPQPAKTTSQWSNNQSAQPVRNSKPGILTRRDSNPPKPSFGQDTSTSGAMAPPPAPATSRARRLSHAPQPSSTAVAARPPRKSIGPGTTLPDNMDAPPPRRRPSISSRKNTFDGNRISQPSISQRDSQPPPNRTAETGPGSVSNARYQKAKSLQPPSRQRRDSLIAPSQSSDHSRSSSNNAIRTPVKSNAGRTATPSSTKRISVMPPHASGLGARTISPTDARRLKRMSLMPHPPPMPHTPPTQDPLSSRPRSSAQSPSMIPRKSVTPSSSRTTPDPHRKSYSSGISLSSSTSYNSARNSSGSFQPRVAQNISTSRLPTPKPRPENASNTEDVPPVPAIPKAYESPKADGEQPQFTTRKSSLPFDISGPPTGSTQNSESSAPSSVESATNDADVNTSHNAYFVPPDLKTRPVSSINRKNLQPLKLPPLNLLPISLPMASKIESLKDKDHLRSDLRISETPPLRNNTAKTPSTPMTASKATFFSYPLRDQDAPPLGQNRSTSSAHFALLSDANGFRAQNSSSALEPFTIPSQNRSSSPYISSSLPKSGVDAGVYLRQQNTGEYSRTPGKLTGPRPQTQISAFSSHSEFDSNHEKALPLSTPKQPTTDSKNTNSAASSNNNNNNNAAKYDNMPPPRLPASATWSNMTSAGKTSPSSKPMYLRSRRKPSVTNVKTNGLAPPRTQSISSEQSLTINTSPSTESGEADLQPPRSASSILSPVQKLLNPSRSSSSGRLRPQEQNLNRDDMMAEEEMRRLGSKRKDFETAAKELDEMRRRASPKERVSPSQALKMANLNIFERGEIIDFKDIYFCGTHKAKKHIGDLNAQTANFGYDDERGDYQIVFGDHLAYRYEIVDVLGKGSFGQVVRCVDHKTGVLVAVKIIRNKKRFHQQALVEVNILQKLKEWDPHRRHSVVNFTKSFYFRGHLCISTELLGMNLYEFIKAHDFKGFSLKLIRRFTKQLLGTLVLLHQHRVIHCDLKPENVLLAHPMHSEIKVIDFGSSCFENEKVYTYIQSRFYRSPEVILGMSYGMPIDMWSLGCILAELYTGYPIFPGENEQEQLACIMEVFGPPEKHLIEKSTRKKLFFDSLGKPRLTVSSKGRRRRPSSKDLRQALKCEDETFLDFIARCLRWDPARRMTPNEAMNHEFITGVKMNPRTRAQLAPLGNSPAKRFISGSTIRPLPEPPSAAPKTRHRDATGSSPIKAAPMAPRRHPTVSGIVASTNTKRSSNPPSLTGSALPRVAGRSASGKPDLATAAAATSLVS
ncbi:CMGC/DYRK/DYRK2 protein kinase [Polytolypa hystricis UAMH7299]|uniref:dual-specificity kinase n=1 Tax=Polytolypa hystricis (strain UAMH7299) TaxID=1447883 RepID=A0A2B7YP22_POLH7|nr:CMGC/DYRK/DYRK2 protein kinase [Polytolypa hystricis UAMH7299]